MTTKAYKHKLSKYIIAVLALSSLTACDFEKVNTNEFELLPEEGMMDGITIGGPITAIGRVCVPRRNTGRWHVSSEQIPDCLQPCSRLLEWLFRAKQQLGRSE